MPQAKPDEETRNFAVRASHDDRRQVHAIEGLTAQEAALTFVEHWFPADPGDQVSVVVVDNDSGRQECFRIDLDSGDAAPCA
jgi:hypothetical protein